MRIVLAANESIGYQCLKILLEQKQDVVGVITDRRYEGSLWKNLRIKRLAEENGIQTYQPKSINDPEFLDVLRKLKPDIIFNIAFIQIYKPPVLSLPRIGCVNFHPGPLPQYGGLNPWVWAIINNETEYGVTLHYMREKVDAGEILGYEKFSIDGDETGLSLLLKCYQHGATLFRKVLRNIIENKVILTPQDLTKRTYFLNRIPYDGLIDINWDVERIERFVRAMSFAPFPNPYSPAMVRFNDNQFIITKATVLERGASEKIYHGQVIDIYEDGIEIQTRDGKIRISLLDHSNPKMNTKELCDFIGIDKGTILGGGDS
jgi:methionyl-tRNA formyltransferase